MPFVLQRSCKAGWKIGIRKSESCCCLSTLYPCILFSEQTSLDQRTATQRMDEGVWWSPAIAFGARHPSPASFLTWPTLSWKVSVPLNPWILWPTLSLLSWFSLWISCFSWLRWACASGWIKTPRHWPFPYHLINIERSNLETSWNAMI